ncbi:hypothetical protein SESBI_19547 [Sesbania bispinosa]|nr:hypothetical protein SESBI_19547 [Sesbania bispinosa]
MDWYYGCGSSDFLVPKDQDLLDRHPSPDSWSKWGICAPEGFNSPKKFLIKDTNSEEVEFNFIDESFNNEVEFEPSPYYKDQSSSSSACGGSSEQSFQQTALSCDQPKYQLQELSSFEQMDDIFLYKRNLWDYDTWFYACGLQEDIEASEFVPCNSNSKDCQDTEAANVLDPFEQSSRNEAMHEQSSFEESTLQDLEMIVSQFTEKTRLCFRDALYRLARNTKQHHVVEDLDGGLNMQPEMPWAVHNEILRSEDKKPIESETNSVDRAVANLMFNKMEINILKTPDNIKQEVIERKGHQGKGSKALNVAQKSHYTHPQKLPEDALRFGQRDHQQTARESYISYAGPIKKSFLLEFG